MRVLPDRFVPNAFRSRRSPLWLALDHTLFPSTTCLRVPMHHLAHGKESRPTQAHMLNPQQEMKAAVWSQPRSKVAESDAVNLFELP